MNFQEVEKLKKELLSTLPNIFGKTKLFKISSFYTAILSTEDKNIIEAYSLDFITEYLSVLKLFTPFYQAPDKTEFLLAQLKELRSVSTLSQFENEFDELRQIISSQLTELQNILIGEPTATPNRTLSFPLIESFVEYNDLDVFGTLESVSIKIHPTKGINKFVFVPSDKKVEEQLLTQAKISLEIALEYFNDHKKKFHKLHEVLIYFENLSGNYEGNSLGLALTIGFIEQLSILYNLPYITNIKNNIATTGGVDLSSKVIPISEKIVEKKIEIVFYSNVNSIVIPKEDELFALQRLIQLQIKYPKRKLNLIAISDINDIIIRRDLIDIKKQSPIVRTARAVKRNWIAVSLTLVLLLMIRFIWMRDFDDNPAIIVRNGEILQIKNQSGKLLWNTKAYIDVFNSRNNNRVPKQNARLLDIDNDGVKEVLLARELENNSRIGSIVCRNKQGIKIWEYSFNEKATSFGEDLSKNYHSVLLDIFVKDGNKYIICAATNSESFSSSIFILDTKTGERVFDVLWHAGFVLDGFVKSTNNSTKLFFGAINNGYEKVALAVIDIENITGQAFSTHYYTYKNIPHAKFDSYILLPKTDFCSYSGWRNSSIFPGGLVDLPSESKITIPLLERYTEGTVIYKIAYNFKDIDIVIGNDLRLLRDSLVVHGKLPKPLTDTQEFRNMLKSQILYWNGKEFVKKNELN